MRLRLILAVLLVPLCVPFAEGAEAPEGASITFVAKNKVATANGTFHKWKVVSSDIKPDDPAASFVEVEVDLASIDTGNQKRDDHLRNPDFFEVEKYPVAKVRAHSASSTGTDADGRKSYSVKFDIDLHGVKKTLDGTFAVVSDSPLQVEGTLMMDRVDFGIGEPYASWNPLSITQEVPVKFRATVP